MWKEEDLKDLEYAVCNMRIYLDIMLGYLENIQDEKNSIQLITLTNLIYSNLKRITCKF